MDHTDFAKMLGLTGQPRKKHRVLDKIPFPADKVKELLELTQKAHETKDATSGRALASRAVWEFIHKVLPITRTQECSIDGHNATVPYINIHGPAEKFEVGKRTRDGHRILATYEIPEDCLFRTFELSDMEEAGPIHRYNFWMYLASIFPDMPNDGLTSHTFVSTASWTGVITVDNSEDGDDSCS